MPHVTHIEMTVVQTSKMRRVSIVLLSRSYWSGVINFDRLVQEMTVDRGDLGLFYYADDAEGLECTGSPGLQSGPRLPGLPSISS